MKKWICSNCGEALMLEDKSKGLFIAEFVHPCFHCGCKYARTDKWLKDNGKEKS